MFPARLAANILPTDEDRENLVRPELHSYHPFKEECENSCHSAGRDPKQ